MSLNAVLSLGMNAVDGFPCLYISKTLTLFVYVDDIIIAFHSHNVDAYKQIEQKLVDLYNLRCLSQTVSWHWSSER